MRLGHFEFRPERVPTVATVLLLALLLWLGFWQLERAAQKAAWVEQHGANVGDVPLQLNAEVAALDDFRFRTVLATGRYLGARQILLDNQVHEGQVGYHVYTPFHLEAEKAVILVNRGWVPLGVTRDVLPQIPVATDRRTITGMLNRPPSVGIRLQAPASTAWPRVVQYVDPEALGASLGYKTLPRVVWLDPSEPNGFVREWKIVAFGPERHRGYAVQWFALAAALVIIYFVVNIRRVGVSQPT